MTALASTTFNLIQTSLHWESPQANRDHLLALSQDADDGVLLLPEMFSTGFSMASEQLAESMDGPTIAWMAELARTRQAPVAGSVIIRDAGACFNRFVWMPPDGRFASYDKRHLFRMADEHNHYAAGRQNLLIAHQQCRIRPQICYDLRFPAWSRNPGIEAERYDVLIYVANWPAARRSQWLALLQARAIENLCYVIGLNRIGSDGNGVAYCGDSTVFGPDGEVQLALGERDGVFAVTLDMEKLRAFRQAFPAYLDADQLTIN